VTGVQTCALPIYKGFNPEFGARPLRRAIEHYIEDPLSEQMLRGEFKEKNVIRISVQDEDNLRFDGIKDEAVAAEKTVVVNTPQPT
jgi:ATP-dependent Clp protease ATP-binding subunit ClpC